LVGEAIFSHDLTRRPGWRLLDEGERERVISVGLAYLRAHELQPEHWRGLSRVSPAPALRDWAGVYLLTTLTRHEPERVQGLDDSTWVRFAAAIVGAWNHDRDEDAYLRARLVQLAPDDGRRHIVKAALNLLDADADGGRGLPHRPLYEELILDLSGPVSDRLAEGRYSEQLGAELLDLLAQHAPEKAAAVCRILRANRTDLSARAARHLAQLDPEPLLAELLSGAPPEQNVMNIIPHLNIADLDSSQLGQLAMLLLDRFSLANDPPMQTGFRGPDAAFETRRVRSRVWGKETRS
jgi:hypothetical protein